MSKKDNLNFNLGLPADKKCFQKMNDILYTYLYSISKHNPAKDESGNFIEQYRYIYKDKDPKTGKQMFCATEIMKELGMKRTTFYRKYNQLISLGLIEEAYYGRRKVILIPFLPTDKILNMKTCKYLSTLYSNSNLNFSPTDIIKILAVLKIKFYDKNKTFTLAWLKQRIGYSIHYYDKDLYFRFLLDILNGLGIIDFYINIDKQENKTIWYYNLTNFDDSFNAKIKQYEYIDRENIKTSLTNEEVNEIYLKDLF